MSTSDGSTRKHSHYHKDVGHLLTMDVYRLCERFEINDPSGATQHAIKKLVCAGQRGSKGLLQDLQEAVDTINRRIEMIYEDQTRDALLSTAFGQQNMIDPECVEISEKSAKCKGCFAGCRDCCPGLAKIADEKLARMRAASAERFVNECVGFLSEPSSAIDDDSERMQAIGNDGEHYGAPDWWTAPDNAALYIDWTGSAAGFDSAFYCDGGDRFYRIPLRTGTPLYVLKLENGFPDIDYPYFMRPAK